MSTVKANNLQGGGGVNRNDKAAVQLSGSAALNVTGDFEMDNSANVVVPIGSEDQRPASPSAGQVRVNNTAGSGTLEGYNGTEWISLTAPPAQPVAGSSAENPASSCYDMLTNDNITQNGFYWIDSSGTATLTWCFMEAPWGEPDYSLLTPYGDMSQEYNTTYGWFHQDDRDVGNMTGASWRTNPGIEYFVYFCDGCDASKQRYNYPAPSGHVIHWYGGRSHCGGDQTFGYPGMSNSCANNISNYNCNNVFRFAGVTTTNVGFEQHNDGCGDPNEATLVVVSKVQGTSRPAPSINTWKTYFRDCNWRYGGTNSRNG
ncbi:hypothetical protein SWYG_00019 [Synechococcus phage S-IOM18]|uniref:Uncharacterized protein n=1 Tax=Synechococcus phage S-IOM18 TaxID=754039 RepID=R9TLP8_9CAUD|nr:hypothetical protein SWYG_00019 [Synechococcus phage S-IOM18]AGN33531.1 hypothetical protein SWYG_00019 [Synechococcus phage S-IOM18]